MLYKVSFWATGASWKIATREKDKRSGITANQNMRFSPSPSKFEHREYFRQQNTNTTTFGQVWRFNGTSKYHHRKAPSAKFHLVEIIEAPKTVGWIRSITGGKAPVYRRVAQTSGSWRNNGTWHIYVSTDHSRFWARRSRGVLWGQCASPIVPPKANILERRLQGYWRRVSEYNGRLWSEANRFCKVQCQLRNRSQKRLLYSDDQIISSQGEVFTPRILSLWLFKSGRIQNVY